LQGISRGTRAASSRTGAADRSERLVSHPFGRLDREAPVRERRREREVPVAQLRGRARRLDADHHRRRDAVDAAVPAEAGAQMELALAPDALEEDRDRLVADLSAGSSEADDDGA